LARRVTNTSALNFGTFGAAATINRVRQQKAAADSIIFDLASAVAVAINEQFEIAAGGYQADYKNGTDGNDGHISAMVDAFYGNSTDGFESFTLDLISGAAATAPITVSGYSAQTWNAFTFSTVPD